MGNILENDAIKHFADVHLIDAVRIMNTKELTPFDSDIAIHAVSLVVHLYMNKLQSGEIVTLETLH